MKIKDIYTTNFSIQKILFVIGLLYSSIYNLSAQSIVSVEVVWPSYAEENLVQIRDAANTTVFYQDCVPGNCFVDTGANLAYTNAGSVALPAGNYQLLNADRFQDGWQGAATVRVFVDGVLLFTDTFPAGYFEFVPFTVTDTGVNFNPPLTIYDEFDGHFDYAVTGASFRNQPDAVDPCSITTTATANGLTSTIPPTATIEKAYLLWAQSNYERDDQITFEGQLVTPDLINSYLLGTSSYFGMVSDVTTLVSTIPNPSTNVYDFTNLSINNTGGYCAGTTVIGAWSLIIFYSDPSLPASTINIYNGFNGLQDAAGTDPPQSFLLDDFFANGSSGSKTTILSWEGDIPLTNNEQLTVTPTSTGIATELSGDGDNDGTILDNPFNSTVFDGTTGVNRTEYGLDLDTYDITAVIPVGETSLTTNVDVGQDLVILNSVILKVSSNLITGTVFEDINYPGGSGRNLSLSSGIPLENAIVELYNSSNVLEKTTTTDSNGMYVFGGMLNDTYTVRVVNSSVRSSRTGGASCTNCIPVQTFKTTYASSTHTEITNQVGGSNPNGQDTAAGVLIGAQTIASIAINNEGPTDIDFGFNFNTIVNTNANGQGSLEQFIINSNNLGNTGVDIEVHPNNASLNPDPEEDTSIFMIPSNPDPLGRTTDTNFAGGIFSITQSTQLSAITDTDTFIDGRTQTAYSGDTNTGMVGSGGTNVGSSATVLPNYNQPEIQIDGSTLGDVFRIQGNGTTIRNLAIYANGNVGIQNTAGSVTKPTLITENLIGVNANGVLSTRLTTGVRVSGTAVSEITNNYMSQNGSNGISINGGASTIVQYNDIEDNGNNTCADGIALSSGTGVQIQYNLINNTAGIGIDGWNYPGGAIIDENTITNSGQNGGICSGAIENNGIRLFGSNSSITSNIIANNGGAGIVLTGGNTSGNLISQNSIYNNGTSSPALGIDIDQSITGNPVGDGVTINDTNDSDNGPNGSLNFPVFESAVVSGTILKVVGWVRPGATVEFFLTDTNQGTANVGDNQLGLTQDYGEGQIFLGSAIEGSGADVDATTSSYIDADGNTDTTNRFNFTINLSSSIPTGSIITATATVVNSTSEFGNTFPVGAATVITNRKITYRVNK
ncbi:beta strand repeat-containing protein [Aquimarina muelleri]|uniref:beta strand repeat-containing protein n=1 Tax=Aquimarina muelleri TaxID=279356 RepID=UPI003F688229